MSGDKLRSPHVSWVFAQLVTFPIFGPGATFGWPSPSSLTRVHLPQRGRRDLAPPLGAATSRWDVAQRPVSAAASVGAGRLPLADSTRGGSRDAGTATAVTERATCPRRARALFSCTGAAFSRRPLARIARGATPANRQRRHSAGRERRGKATVSLAFFYALRAYKVKVEAFLKKSFTKKLYARFARPPARTCAGLLMSTSDSELP